MLSPAVSAALARFRAALTLRFGARLREIVLFGSHARGDAHEESDVDVLVVIDGLSESERTEILDASYRAEDGDGWVGLSPLPFSTAQAAEARARGRLVFRDIEREGVPS